MTSIYDEKTKWKQTNKTLQKVGIKEKYFNMVKAIYDKFTANIIWNGKKLKVLPLRFGRWQEWSTITTLFNIVLNALTEGWMGERWEGCSGWGTHVHPCWLMSVYDKTTTIL